MAMKSKYNNRCAACGNMIAAGRDWIEPKELPGLGKKWVHVKCPSNGQSALGTTVQHNNKVYQSSVNVPLAIEDDFDVIQAMADNAIELNKIEETEKKAFLPSKYQQAIFDAITAMVDGVSDFNHLVVEAVAGSGKTTTMEKSLGLIPEIYRVVFLAFNKHIADELDKRCRNSGLNHVTAATLHRLGKINLQNHFPKIKVDRYKLDGILDDYYPVSRQAVKDGLITEKQQHIHYIKRKGMRNLVSISKSVLVDAKDKNAVIEMIERYNTDIDTDVVDELVELLPNILEECKKRTETMDFDDMIWLPVVLNLKMERYDYLMVDEAQDMNKCQIMFIMMVVSENGHIIAVGDRYQSLYGFRGADTNAVQNIIDMLSAKTLPLSVTYRCPTSHVDIARAYVPQLEARENAPVGVVDSVDFHDLSLRLQAGDMVICRTNAPLVKPAFQCIRMKKKAIIRGVEIGENLVNLIKRFETNDLGQFDISLTEYFEVEYKKLMDKGREMQAELLQDKVDTLRLIMNECNDVAGLIARIDTLFSDTETGIVFSSVHRAKGLEAERVYILRPDLMPHQKAKKDWEKQQELNCLYVAQTRSKSELIFVKGGENI